MALRTRAPRTRSARFTLAALLVIPLFADRETTPG